MANRSFSEYIVEFNFQIILFKFSKTFYWKQTRFMELCPMLWSCINGPSERTTGANPLEVTIWFVNALVLWDW